MKSPPAKRLFQTKLQGVEEINEKTRFAVATGEFCKALLCVLLMFRAGQRSRQKCRTLCWNWLCLKKIASYTCDMIVEYLKSEFIRRSRRNSNYSLRSFARSLGMDSSTLSAIIRGKRNVSFKMAKRLLDQLELQPTTRKKIVQSLLNAKESKSKSYFEISSDVLATISSWENFAVLSLLETEDAKSSSAWVAERLKINLGRAIEVVDQLERLGLIVKENGKWSVTHKELTTSQDVPSSALRKAHKEYIEKSIASMESVPVNLRDLTGMTMAIDSSKIAEAKELIKNFRRDLANLLEAGKRDEVYRVNIQFYPLTKKGNTK